MSYNNMQPSTTAILGFAGTGVVLNGVLAAHRLCKLIKGQGESVEAMNKPTSEGGVDGCCRDNVYGMTVAARDEACSLAGCAALTLYAAHMCTYMSMKNVEDLAGILDSDILKTCLPWFTFWLCKIFTEKPMSIKLDFSDEANDLEWRIPLSSVPSFHIGLVFLPHDPPPPSSSSSSYSNASHFPAGGRTRSVTDPVATALLALSSAQIASHFVEHPIAEKARPVLQVAQLGILGYCIGQLLDWF